MIEPNQSTSPPKDPANGNSILTTRNPGVNWSERRAFPRSMLNIFERLSLVLEKPLDRFVREQKFNPLYHTGTITVFLLLIVLGTGIYLTMFYQFGFEASYEAVAQIETNFVGRVMRALHRYASGAAVIVALLHGWRTFFQDRFRGPRWLAWVSGVLMSVLVWLIGISGYWLIWDQRAGVLNQILINLLKNSRLGTAFLIDYLVSESAGSGWVFLVLVITVHLGLSAIVGVFFWLHIKRLSRTKWLPPQYWMVVITALLGLASLLIPLGMLAPLDNTRLPETISIDLFYLFYLPMGLQWLPIILWGGVILLIGILSIFPWILVRKKRPPVVVDPERCTGCTLCAKDCPYQAIEMKARKDEKKHKYLAIIDSQMCVACGICIGSCDPLAMTLSEKSAEAVWLATLSWAAERSDQPVRVIFTCERHAYQNIEVVKNLCKVGDEHVHIVPLACVGMAHPKLATQALEAGANAVQFIGCPPDDCANREGNLWLQERLNRERLPKLNQKFIGAPIYSDWLAPNDFSQALQKPNQQREASSYNLAFSHFKWQNFIPAILLLSLLLVAQIRLSDIDYRPYPSESGLVEIALNHKAGYPLQEVVTNLEPELGLSNPTRLVLEIDDYTTWDHAYPPYGKEAHSVAFEQIDLRPGKHHLQLKMFDRPGQIEGQILFDDVILFGKYDILKLSYDDAALSSDPLAGRELFFESSLSTSASCHVCHSLEKDEIKVGPSLFGIANLAAERIAGMTAEAYLRESIVDPDAYIVNGFPAGLMLPDFDENLTSEQIDNLVAFLLTLK